MKFDFKVIGLELLKSKLQKDTVKEPVDEGIKKITLWTHRTAMQSTPVDTGRLRASVTSQRLGEMGKVGTNVQYAQFVEYGTKHMEPRHVVEGSATRQLGKGPFTYTMEKLQEKIKEFLGEIGKAIEVRFG
jgi:HK97 gp10 family phage protein